MSRLRDEHGFTLVELLTAMACGLIVLFAAMAAFDGFQRGVASSNRLTSSEDAGRHALARMVAVVRNAGAPSPTSGAQPAAVTRAQPNDLVFRSTAWPGASGTGSTGTHMQRLCLDTASKTVWFDGLQAGTAGPTDPGTACPSQAPGWTHKAMATKVLNSDASGKTLFRLPATTPVRSVGLRLLLEHGTVQQSQALELNSGGVLRGALASAVTPGDIGTDCTSDGSGKALLSLNLSGGAGSGGLTLSATNAIAVGPTKLLVNAAAGTTTSVALTVTDALGLQTLLTKPVTC